MAAIQNEKEKKGYFWTYADQDSRRVGEGSGGRGDLGGQAASEMKYSRSRDDISAGLAGRGQALSCFVGAVALGGFVSGRIKPGNRLLINCISTHTRTHAAGEGGGDVSARKRNAGADADRGKLKKRWVRDEMGRWIWGGMPASPPGHAIPPHATVLDRLPMGTRVKIGMRMSECRRWGDE